MNYEKISYVVSLICGLIAGVLLKWDSDLYTRYFIVVSTLWILDAIEGSKNGKND